ncbi:MAG: hypothetical protein AAB935_01070 [Patescibacteria group bacterium]
MEKKISIILSLIILIPLLSSAQVNDSVLPDTINLLAPISNFIDKLKNINIGESVSLGEANSEIDLSSAKSIWEKINNWFSSHIGVSFTDIIKAIFNFIIWIWELIIKLIRVGLSYL